MPESVNYNHKPIVIWLLICAATIFFMVILGGVTRLTGSGLSMVQWKPLMGILPPLTEADWLSSFRLYQQYPEFQIRNSHMSLSGYKSIFWLEYFHRLLGRSIGLMFLVPMLVFLFLKKVEPALKPKLWLMFILGGLQGLLGWYMVKSGLSNDPHVSQYRLVAHLGLAVIIYAYIFWVAIGLWFNDGPHQQPETQLLTSAGFKQYALFLSGIAFLTILSGGFVAGLKAGLIFNTFPLMDGRLIPVGLTALEPLWRNLFENLITVQFNHRLIATSLFFLVIGFWFLSRKQILSRGLQVALNLLLLMVVIQVMLGISTLLLAVPTPLAAAHQAGALCVFTLLLYIARRVC